MKNLLASLIASLTLISVACEQTFPSKVFGVAAIEQFYIASANDRAVHMSTPTVVEPDGSNTTVTYSVNQLHKVDMPVTINVGVFRSPASTLLDGLWGEDQSGMGTGTSYGWVKNADGGYCWRAYTKSLPSGDGWVLIGEITDKTNGFVAEAGGNLISYYPVEVLDEVLLEGAVSLKLEYRILPYGAWRTAAKATINNYITNDLSSLVKTHDRARIFGSYSIDADIPAGQPVMVRLYVAQNVMENGDPTSAVAWEARGDESVYPGLDLYQFPSSKSITYKPKEYGVWHLNGLNMTSADETLYTGGWSPQHVWVFIASGKRRPKI